MALQAVITEVRKFIGSTYSSVSKEVASQKYGTVTVLGVTLMLALGSVFGGRHLYVQSRERAASKAFTHYLQEYRQAETLESPDWAHLSMLFKMGYDEHSGSSLAPFFLMFQADTLMKQNETTQALEAMDTALDSMNSDHSLYNAYKTKRALAKLDASDEAVQKQGLEELVALANDKNNKQQDVALYYVGLYNWNAHEVEVAKKIWTQLINSQSAEKQGKSPWAVQAQKFLQQIS